MIINEEGRWAEIKYECGKFKMSERWNAGCYTHFELSKYGKNDKQQDKKLRNIYNIILTIVSHCVTTQIQNKQERAQQMQS